jgi:serine/threonine protein kinase
LGELLGEGGFGTVFEARSESGRTHALKVVEDKDAYHHEVAVLSEINKLQCKHLVYMEDFFKDQASGALCIVTPIMQGGSLRDVM